MFQLQAKVLLLLIFTTALISCQTTSNQFQSIAVSSPDKDAAEPAISVALNGNIYIVWVEHGSNNDADVMLRRFDSKGNPNSEPVRVNPQIGQATAWRGDPPTIKVGNDGIVYIGWTAKVEGAKGGANILYLSVSRDNGQKFEAPIKVNDDIAPASHGMHSLAVDNSGRVYFAWLDERYLNSQKAEKESVAREYHFEKSAFFQQKAEMKHKPEPNAELYFAVSNDGGKTFSPNKKLAENICPCCKTSLLAAPDNNLYVSWRQVLTGDFRHIAVTASNNNGNSFTQSVIVSDDKWQINACPVSGASLAISRDNALRVSWFTAGAAGKTGFYLAESKDNGETFSPRILIGESTTGGTPSLLIDQANNNKIIWSEAGKLLMAKSENESLNFENKHEIGNGEVPATTALDGQVFISFIGREKDKRNIKLSIVR